MKIQSLLIAAAALAAGVMHSQAQVYSQNIVGYINVPLVAGNNLIANQLDFDGTGTNNTIATVFPNGVENKATISAWNGTGFVSASYVGGTWSGTANTFITNALQPGSGFFIDVKTATNVTFVGNVLVGTNTIPIPAGLSIVAPLVPVAGTIDTTNGYNPTSKDVVNVWNPGSSTFTSYSYVGGTWSPSDPQLSVAQAIFLNAKKSTNWTTVLNVQ